MTRGAIAVGAFIAACSSPSADGVSTTPNQRPGTDGGVVVGPDGAILPAPGDLKFATYNVETFFDTKCDSGLCAATDFEQALSPDEFAAKVTAVAKGVEMLGADVVVVEEVEKQLCLDEVQKKVPAYVSAKVGETDLNGSLDVGILAKDPIVAIRTHRQDKIKLADGTFDRFTREFLEVDLDRKGTIYTVFVGHFKSKRDNDPARRLAEAETAREIVLARAKAAPERLVVMGCDCNDSPGSPPINALEAQTAAGKLLRVEAIDLAPAAQTTFFGSFKSGIDHILLPSSLSGRHVKSSTRVVSDGAGKGLSGSDHAGLLAQFHLAP